MRQTIYPFSQGLSSLLVLTLLSILGRPIQAQTPGVTTITQSFSYTGQIVTWTVPTGVTSLTIEARGAEGGRNSLTTIPAGKGAIIGAQVSVTPGQSISILVGQQNQPSRHGGGGSFVVSPGSFGMPFPLVIAGGGGGSSEGIDSNNKHGQLGRNGAPGSANGGMGGTDGLGGMEGSTSGALSGGGGGLLGDGGGSDVGGRAFINGGAGGHSRLGFGGYGGGGVNGGNTFACGGGGGGFSGGGGAGGTSGNNGGVGGGGGSYYPVAGLLFSKIGAVAGNTGNGLVTITYAPPPQPIRYVKPVATGTGDGTSWANASGDLQSQIDIAGAEQVWVATGIYKPGPANNTNRSISFVMKNGVAIYGGFPSDNSGTLANRNPASFTTVLSGDIDGDGTLAGNSYHVVSISNASAATRLDGFVITSGNAGGGGESNNGGGIYNIGSGGNRSNPTLVNLTFVQHLARFGAGMFNRNGSPSLTNVSFSQNTAVVEGGGIYNDAGSPLLTNCLFSQNRADNGGAMLNYQSSNPLLTNCSFSQNTATTQGGALRNNVNSHPSLTNCILWENGGQNAIVNLTSTNGGTTANYCLIEPAETDYTGQNNRALDPLFVDAAAGNLQLKPCSPTIDAGDDSVNTAPIDLAGNNRRQRTIDIGAYEFQGTPSSSVAVTQQPVSGSSVCGGSAVTAMVSVSGTVSSYQWYLDGQPVVGQNSATLSLTNVQLGDSGSYSVVVTGSCNSVTSLAFSLTVNAPPTASLTNNGPISCSTTSVTLTASGGNTYQFSNGANQIGNGPTATVSSAGIYSVTIISGNGCSSVASTTVAGDVSVPVAGLTNNGPISCSITSVTLTASGGSTYRFSSGATQTGNGPTATVSTPGVYSVTVISANGCSATASTTVAGDQKVPTAGLTNNGPISCSTTSVTLNASGEGSYRFSSGVNQINNGPTATVTTAGVYSVTVVSTNGCSATASTTVVGDVSVPTAGLTNNGPISCSMTSVTLTASGGSTGETLSYRFSSGATQVGSGPTATVTTAGVYSVTVMSGNGCSATVSTTVGATTADCSFALIAPLYNCLTGAIVFRTQGATSPVEYRAIGVTDWTTNPNQTVDLPVRQDANAQPLLLQARQSGVMVTYTFDFRVYCNSTVPNQPPVFTQPPTQTATVGQPFAYRIPDNTFRDLNGTAVNFMASNLPAGLSYTADTRVISGVPTAVGSYSVTLSVSDPLSLSASGVLVIQVNPVAQPPVSTTVNQAPVFNGPLAAQTGTVGSGFAYQLPVGVFTDPNAGDVLTYQASGLPPGLSFNRANQAISGTPTTAGTYSVSLTATDGGGLPASGLLTITISTSATSPPTGPQPLAVIQPLYDCQTGAITFRTSGGDGSPIYFTSVGIVGYSTQTRYVLEAAIRNDANSQPLLIKATQSGVTTSYRFDFRLYCNGTVVTNPPVFNGPLPTQMGTVGVSLSYQLPPNSFTALNGGTLNYVVTGLPAGLSFTAGSNLISGVPTQAGSVTATITATDPLNQSGQGPLVFVIAPAPAQPPVGAQPLTLLAPLYDCGTGSFTFQTTGGNGTPIEYVAVGITSYTTITGPYTVRPAGDAQPFTLKARQSGVEVTYRWDFKAVCSSSTRIGVAETSSRWTVKVLGNPVTEAIHLEVQGAMGQELALTLMDVSGRVVLSQVVRPDTLVHQEVLLVDPLNKGLLLLRVSSAGKSQTVKVLRQ